MWAGSADEQGVYALVSALGALFVRIVLQPLRYDTLSVFLKLWNVYRPDLET